MPRKTFGCWSRSLAHWLSDNAPGSSQDSCVLPDCDSATSAIMVQTRDLSRSFIYLISIIFTASTRSAEDSLPQPATLTQTKVANNGVPGRGHNKN
ncbi:unnamed protein product [Linum tenue]|uniref:Uncharacterized protein n=1 Tax=Linum tenue TaxID=586396 RepID=A0AAV0QB78_9ROSI|nr:unnamed protein product [Linum tenue]